MAECQYWIRVIRPDPRQGDDNPYFPFVHRLDRNPKWSHGYNPMPVLKNEDYREGPFSTRAATRAFYEANKMSLPGAHNRKEIDYTDDHNCDDQ